MPVYYRLGRYEGTSSMRLNNDGGVECKHGPAVTAGCDGRV